MTRDVDRDDVDREDDVLGLPTLAKLVQGDVDEEEIRRESPRAADDSRYFAFEMDNGHIGIADDEDKSLNAWISAEDPDDLPDRR